MSDLYTIDTQKIKTEIDSIKNSNKIHEIYQIKLELLQVYQMCYTLYKKVESDEIKKKLCKLTELLEKCIEIEKYANQINLDKDCDRRRTLKSIVKVKKDKSSISRIKYKKKNDDMIKRSKKEFNGKI